MTQPDDVMEALIVLIRQRREKGIATYGKTLTAETPVDLRLYALEEALDLSAYLLAECKRLEAELLKEQVRGDDYLESISGWEKFSLAASGYDPDQYGLRFAQEVARKRERERCAVVAEAERFGELGHQAAQAIRALPDEP